MNIRFQIFSLLPMLFASQARANDVELLLKDLHSSDKKVRMKAAGSLSELNDPQAILPLAECESKDTASKVRSACERALKKMAGRSAGDAARKTKFFLEVETALKKANGKTAASLLWSLKLLKEERAIPIFVRYLGSPDRDVRRKAAGSCANCMALDGSAVPALIKALDDKDKYVRSGAAANLGKIGSAKAVPRLGSCASADKKDNVREACVRALGRIGDASAAKPLLALLKGKNKWTRTKTVLEALAGLKGRNGNTVEVVIPLLDHKKAPVIGAACKVLGAEGANEASAKITQVLQKGSPCAKSSECKTRCRTALKSL